MCERVRREARRRSAGDGAATRHKMGWAHRTAKAVDSGGSTAQRVGWDGRLGSWTCGGQLPSVALIGLAAKDYQQTVISELFNFQRLTPFRCPGGTVDLEVGLVEACCVVDSLIGRAAKN